MSSLLMIVAAMVEFAVVMILKYKFMRSSTQTLTQAKESESTNMNIKSVSQLKINKRVNDSKLAWRAIQPLESVIWDKTIHEKMDDISFVVFPMIYALFNVTYVVTCSQFQVI